MRVICVAILFVGLASCGKSGSSENAALTAAGPICADVLSCHTWCDTNFKPSKSCVSIGTGDALCPATVNSTTCVGVNANFGGCLVDAGCAIGYSPQSCQAA